MENSRPAKEITITPVKCTLTLKDKQYDGMNRWRFTFDGEDRLSTCKYVEYYALTIEDVLLKYKTYQVEKVRIEVEYN